MAGHVQYAQQTDDASRSACSRIHGNDSTAYYKRDDRKDLPARPFDDIPAGKTEKAKIHSQHKPGYHRHTISQCSHHKTAPFVLYSIKTIITSISYDMRRPPSKMRESFQRKQVYTKRMGMENPITPQSVIRLPLSLNRTCSGYHKKPAPLRKPILCMFFNYPRKPLVFCASTTRWSASIYAARR